MTARIVRAALVAALCAGVLYGIVAGYEWWRDAKVAEGDRAGAARVKALWDADKIEWARLARLDVENARKDEQRIAADAAQGEKHARDIAEAQAARDRAAAARSAAAAGGLRDDLAALDASARALGVPDAAACPAAFAQQRDDAIRARAVFGACVGAYQLLAESAGRDRADLQLRLDTALSWIRATGAPGAQDLSQ